MMNKKMMDMGNFELTLLLDKALEETACNNCPMPETSSEFNKCRYCAVVNIVNLFGIDKYDMEQMLDSLERRIGGDR